MENGNEKYLVPVYELICNDNDPKAPYGIRCKEGGVDVDTLGSLSSNKEAVEGVISEMNRFRVDPLHFRDVVDDLLG